MALQLSAHVEWQVVDQEALILDMAHSHYCSLNSTATCIMQELLKGRSPEETAQFLCEHYDIDTLTALNDVNDVIDQMLTKQILVSQP